MSVSSLESKKVSIIIPVYNQEKYLAETLNSVINQNYSNWECILVNDGSSDDSVAVINKYVAQDNRFHFINSENKGVSHARNLALKQVKGDFILFLDGDDLIHPEKLQKAISNFQENANLSIVFNNTNYFQDTIENTLYPINIEADLLNFNDLLLFWNEKIIIPIHSAIIKKSLFDGIEFNTDLTAQEDWLVWLRLFQKKPHNTLLIALKNKETNCKNLPFVMYKFKVFIQKLLFFLLSKIVFSNLKYKTFINDGEIIFL